jgi:hypothetical protein
MSVYLCWTDAAFVLEMAEHYGPRAKDERTRAAFERVAAKLRAKVTPAHIEAARTANRGAARKHREGPPRPCGRCADCGGPKFRYSAQRCQACYVAQRRAS